MPNKLIGTLIALFFFGLLFNISTCFLFPRLVNAQLSELTEIQNSVFHLSIKDYKTGITSETFKTDKYIDNWQAEYFSELSRPKINTPADDNYPFTLVDHYILDSDLEIDYKYDNILCSNLPQTAYLSRHNLSIEDYTNTKARPTYFIDEIKGTNPFTGEKVIAMHLEVNNDEYFANVLKHKSVTPGEDCYIGYVSNTYVRVDSAQASIWIRLTDTDLMKRCSPTVQNTTCLHPSDIRQPEPIRLIRVSSDNPCIGEPVFPEAPRSSCYYPLPPERTTPAATNWSYNNNLRNGASSSSVVSANSNSRENSQTTDSSCKTCK